MPASSLDWTDLKALGALVRRGSLAGAARELGVDATTVGRRMDALEKAVGTPLFRKSERGREPTEAGARLARLAEEMAQRLTEAHHELDQERGQPRGVVRLTTTEILATALLAPALPALFGLHPELTLELSTTPSRLDLRRGEADLALRFVQPEETGLLRRRIGPIATSAWASEKHVAEAQRVTAQKKRGRAAPPSTGTLDPTRLRAVSYGEGGRAENEWLLRVLGDAPTVLRTGSVGVALEAVVAGVGVAVLPDRIAALRSLVRLDALGAPPQRSLWLAMEPRAAKVPRIRAVAEWLTTAIRG